MDLLSTLATRIGRPAQGLWSAPGRVNLIGEHTDYNAGLCLPVALPLRTSVAAARRDDDVVTVTSAGFPEVVEISLGEVGTGSPKGWGAYVAGVLWALREGGHHVGGLDLAVSSDVPLGSGLSSSAALECAVAAAASDLYDLGLLADDAGRAVLAGACVRAENDVAGAATGGMDQAAALRSREGHALLLDCEDGSIRHVPADLAGHVLLVTDTRSPHALVDGQYASRRRDCERAAAELGVATLRQADLGLLAQHEGTLDDVAVRRARHVITEIDRVREVVAALEVGDLAAVGRAFCASHASLRDDFEVTVARLDVAVSVALEAGALGARMTGGGFGGSSVALVPGSAVAQVTDAIEGAFAARGWEAPATFAVGAAGPARRDR